MATSSSSKENESASTGSMEDGVDFECYFDCGHRIKQEILNLFSLSQKYLQARCSRWVQSSKDNDLKKKVYTLWSARSLEYEKVLASFLIEWESWPSCRDCKIFVKNEKCDHSKTCKSKLKEPIDDDKISDAWSYFHLVGSDYISELILQLQLSRKTQWCKAHWTIENHVTIDDSLKKKSISLDLLCKFFRDFIGDKLVQ